MRFASSLVIANAAERQRHLREIAARDRRVRRRPLRSR
jgi:hypothetical protein